MNYGITNLIPLTMKINDTEQFTIYVTSEEWIQEKENAVMWTAFLFFEL